MTDGAIENGGKTLGGKLAYRQPSLTRLGSVRELTGAFNNSATGDGAGMMTNYSDPAVKENVVRIGEHPAGFGIFLFDYKVEFRDAFGHGRQFGVMADEVERIVPEAVSVADNGYRTVDYAKLGITRH